ncbi:hypothetical protein QTP86_034722 [Hemibagrus guttatus]|nr:hypothetical protein QTP86_034722 [Hemibagrus guttatus]
MQTSETMFQHVFQNFGLPKDIVSDWGPQFTSRVWGSLCAQLGIAYHPQSNGQAERLNQKIDRVLRSYCSREQQHWSEFLPWAEYTQNSLTHSSKGLTPFQCMLGYQPPLFPWSGEPSDVRPWRSGPGCVRRFGIELIYVFKGRSGGRGSRPTGAAVHPPPIGWARGSGCPHQIWDIEGSPAYQVHALLDSRRVRSRIQYLVDWEGYRPEERSWVDAADILDPSLSEDFHRDHASKPAPRPRGQPQRRTPGGVATANHLSPPIPIFCILNTCTH